MKTYCKPATCNIQDPDFNRAAVHKAFLGKLDKRGFQDLLIGTGLISEDELTLARLEADYTKVAPAIDAVCDELTQRIKDGDLDLGPIRQFQRVDGISGKTRTLSQETAEQQIYEYIAVEALAPLFHAKLLHCQYGSVPGKGQVKGVRAIEKILRRKERGRVSAIKGDIRHAYESVTVELVMRLLSRDIGKNKPLLAFLRLLMANYPNGALVIGGYLPTWLFNYVMSYALRQLMSYGRTRRGKFTRYVRHVVCYADDFAIFGGLSNLRKAVKKLERWLKAEFGLEVKQPYTIVVFPTFREEKSFHKTHNRPKLPGLDMMGYVIHRTYTTIRKKIFRRIRRQILAAGADLKRLGHIPWWRALKIMSYKGWIIHSDCRGFAERCGLSEILRAAAKSIGNRSRHELKIKEAKQHDFQSYLHRRADACSCLPAA